MPVTVAGPHRHAPVSVSRVRFQLFVSIVEANLGRALPGGKHGASRSRCRRSKFFARGVEVALIVPTNIRDL